MLRSGTYGSILGRIELRKNSFIFPVHPRIAIRLKRKLVELLMPEIHGSCQRIQTENVEFSIEHRICYLAGRFCSGRTSYLLDCI